MYFFLLLVFLTLSISVFGDVFDVFNTAYKRNPAHVSSIREIPFNHPNYKANIVDFFEIISTGNFVRPGISKRDDSCVSLLGTNKFYPSDCDLPPHCQDVDYLYLEKHFFGYEVGVCYSQELCNSYDKLNSHVTCGGLLYYELFELYVNSRFAAANGVLFLNPDAASMFSLMLVNNGTVSVYHLYSKFCTNNFDASNSTSRTNYFGTFSKRDDKYCETTRYDVLNFCNPIATGKLEHVLSFLPLLIKSSYIRTIHGKPINLGRNCTHYVSNYYGFVYDEDYRIPLAAMPVYCRIDLHTSEQCITINNKYTNPVTHVVSAVLSKIWKDIKLEASYFWEAFTTDLDVIVSGLLNLIIKIYSLSYKFFLEKVFEYNLLPLIILILYCETVFNDPVVSVPIAVIAYSIYDVVVKSR